MAVKALLARKGKTLVPADCWTEEALDNMGDGEIVTATITRTRNVKFHRKFFAFLNIIFRNQSRYLDLNDLLEAMKERIGHGKYIDRTDGRGSFFKSDSISFSKMDESKFNAFYNRFVEVVVQDILPGLDGQDLEREILEIMGN